MTFAGARIHSAVLHLANRHPSCLSWTIFTKTHSWHVQTRPRHTEESSKRCQWQDWTYAKRWKENLQCIFLNKIPLTTSKVVVGIWWHCGCHGIEGEFQKIILFGPKRRRRTHFTFLYKKSSKRFVFSYDYCMEGPGKRDSRCCYFKQWYPVMFLKW